MTNKDKVVACEVGEVQIPNYRFQKEEIDDRENRWDYECLTLLLSSQGGMVVYFVVDLTFRRSDQASLNRHTVNPTPSEELNRTLGKRYAVCKF
jgi:hypothetical protein